MSIKLNRPVLLVVVLGNLLWGNHVAALSLDYFYRGNNFVEFEGIPGLFTPTDHVTARFTLDCAAAHSEDNCKNLPYDDYLEAGAIDLESVEFSAGTAQLPTPGGAVEVRGFSFSTDRLGNIVDWDMDLYLEDPWVNVDTDNVDGGLDTAAVTGGGAAVKGQPGTWGRELSTTEGDFDIVVNKIVDNPAPEGPQKTIEFTVQVQNRGPGLASGVTVLDKLPPELSIPDGMAVTTSVGDYDYDSGRWTIGEMPDTLPQLMTIPAIVRNETQPPCIINTASAEMEGDSDPANNSSSVAVRLPDNPACADLGITELFLYQLASDCDEDFTVSFQIRMYNAGPDPANSVVLEVEESGVQAPDLSMDDASNLNNANCDKLRCTWPVISPGQSVTVTSRSASFNVTEPSEWAIRAEISSADTDYNSENNVYTDRMLLQPHEIADFCGKPSSGDGMDFSGAGGGGGCFVAAAGYGSQSHPNVQTLREFRDNVLMDSGWGRGLVKFYYRHSPKIACYIEEHNSLQVTTRWLLSPIVFSIRHPWAGLALLISMGLLLYASLKHLRRRSPAQ